MKQESIGPPIQYIGRNLRSVCVSRNFDVWVFVLSKYVQESVKNFKSHLMFKMQIFYLQLKTLLSTDYQLEIDMTEELEDKYITCYQSMIGVLMCGGTWSD